MEKFHDSIDWVRALDWACERRFPDRVLRIAMSVHTAPRVIKVEKICGYPGEPANSLVAGCISAFGLSRIVVSSSQSYYMRDV